MPFSTDPASFAKRWIGQALHLHESTAGEFDEATGTSHLSATPGWSETSEIMYLCVSQPDPRFGPRHIFFGPNEGSFGKWPDFIAALAKLDIRLNKPEDLQGMWFLWAEGKRDMGKRKAVQYTEPERVATAEEVAAARAAVGEAAPPALRPAATGTPPAIALSAEEEAVLAVAEGATVEDTTPNAGDGLVSYFGGTDPPVIGIRVRGAIMRLKKAGLLAEVNSRLHVVK